MEDIMIEFGEPDPAKIFTFYICVQKSVIRRIGSNKKANGL